MIKRLRDLAQFLPLSYTLVDMKQDSRPCVFTNEAFEKLTGHSNWDCIGNSLSFLQGDHPQPEVSKFINECYDNEEASVQDLINFKKDGTPFLNRLLLLPIKTNDEEIYLGVQNDITKLKNLDYELECLKKYCSQEERRTIIPITIVLCDSMNELDDSKSEIDYLQKVQDLAHEIDQINTLSMAIDSFE